MISFSVQKDTYELSAGDETWLASAVHGEPKELITGLVRRRFTKPQERFTTDHHLAQACISFARQADILFKHHPKDECLLKRLLSISTTDPDAVFSAFQLLWRGYSDNDLENAEASLQYDREVFLAAVADARRRNRLLLRRKSTRLNDARKRSCRLVASQLSQIARDIRSAYRNPRLIAAMKLRHEVRCRRGRNSVFLDPEPGDYLRVRVRLRFCDPDGLDFPLRHMTNLSAESYQYLLDKWLCSASRDEIILELYRYIRGQKTRVYECLQDLDSTISELLGIDSSIILRELSFAFDHDCYLAVALLATTQTEGLLWQFADFLNHQGIPIFYTSRHRPPKLLAYIWDSELKRYKDSQAALSFRRPRKPVTLYSARTLLNLTRLGTIIPFELYSYLADEFYADRIQLAHGHFSGRKLHVDAVTSIVCLWCTLEFIHGYLTKSKDDSPVALA